MVRTMTYSTYFNRAFGALICMDLNDNEQDLYTN